MESSERESSRFSSACVGFNVDTVEMDCASPCPMTILSLSSDDFEPTLIRKGPISLTSGFGHLWSIPFAVPWHRHSRRSSD